MKKQFGILLAGVAIVAPISLTIYVVGWITGKLNSLGLMPFKELIGRLDESIQNSILFNIVTSVAGIVVVLVVIYLIGLLARFWFFRSLLAWMDRIIARVPGVKTIYLSIRDLMGLFGSGSGRMGKVVEYTPPGSGLSVLAILTNARPAGVSQGNGEKAAIYVPFAYMFGGMTLLVPREHLREVDMPVEQALKLCATAYVSSQASSHLPPQDKVEIGGN